MGSSTLLGMTAFVSGTEFCLNLREHGLRTVSIPYAECMAHFSKGKCEQDVSGFTETLAGNVSTRSLL